MYQVCCGQGLVVRDEKVVIGEENVSSHRHGCHNFSLTEFLRIFTIFIIIYTLIYRFLFGVYALDFREYLFCHLVVFKLVFKWILSQSVNDNKETEFDSWYFIFSSYSISRNIGSLILCWKYILNGAIYLNTHGFIQIYYMKTYADTDFQTSGLLNRRFLKFLPFHSLS